MSFEGSIERGGEGGSLTARSRRLQGGRFRRRHTPRQCLARLIRDSLGSGKVLAVGLAQACDDVVVAIPPAFR